MSATDARAAEPTPAPADAAGQPLGDAEYRQASEWLYREAGLLAARDYDAWLAMLAPELHYRVPMQQFGKRGETREYGDNPAWLDETRDTLAVRCAQLRHPLSNADRVPSFLRYFVTNIQGARHGETLHVSSQVLLLRVRANNPQPFLLSGERHDRLRPGDDGWLLAEREVKLDMPYLDAPNLALFI